MPLPLLASFLAASLLTGLAWAQPPGPPADLILHNGRVWTVDDARPEAQAVAVRADTIVVVGSDQEALALRGPATEVIDLRGRLLLPGFNDAHTHFENAADWFFRLSLFDATSAEEVLRRVAAAAARVPDGLWISGGDFGAYEAWAAEKAGEAPPPRFAPDLAAIDALSPDNPVLLRRWDGAWFANSVALARARWTAKTPDPRGGCLERHPETGELTGMLYGRAGERMAELMPPPSLERTLIGARAALADLRRFGITSIQDVARIEELSQRQLFHTHVERSATNLEIYRELQRRGELSVRVHLQLTLPLWEEILELGIRPWSDEGRIRFGTLKGFIDAYLMEEPFADSPGWAGSFTFRFVDEATMRSDILGADRAGFDIAVHVTGDKAHRLLLDWYEEAYQINPPRERRFRLVHAWYPTAIDIERAGGLGLIADITPYHLIRAQGSLKRKVGPERAARAHPWRALLDAGVHINIVSDWPGSYNERQAIPLRPLENIAYAVSRRPVGADPKRAWHPEQALTVAEAIRAYTIEPARASREEERKGSVRVGKWADLVVLSENILKVPIEQIPGAEVDLTILGGELIYRRDGSRR